MKRLLTILLSISLLFAVFGGCGNNTDSADGTAAMDFLNNADSEDFYLFIYNSKHVSSLDFDAISAYITDFFADENVRMLDAKNCKTAFAIHDAMKALKSEVSGEILGVQILGYEFEVRAFPSNTKMMFTNENVSPESGIQEYVTDFFYANLNNSEEQLKNYSVFADFDENRGVDYTQEWQVARLLVGEDKYAAYFAKYRDYYEKTGDRVQHLNVFSSPIFPGGLWDCVGLFTEKMNKEYGILNKEDYTLYGVLDGYNPVTFDAAGDFTKDTMHEANSAGISDFFSGVHGSRDTLYRTTFFEPTDDSPRPQDGISGGVRNAMDKDGNIFEIEEWSNEIFSIRDMAYEYMNANYFNYLMHSCHTGQRMDTYCLAAMMLSGKGISIIAATTGTANRGIVEPLDEGNPFTLYLHYYENLYGGESHADSFWLAKQDFVDMSLTVSRDMSGDLNYQCLIHNALALHFFGVLR